MFGQDDDQNNNQQNTTTPEPVADATLSHPADDNGSNVPMSDNNNSMVSAPAKAPTEDTTSMPDLTTTDSSQPTSSVSADDDLLSLKQQALQQLSPLVGHLDQSPEDKFHTLMMMIQASDDQSLLKEAYAAAQAIPDEKVKAQALLDVVNEINYFTQAKS